MNRLSALALCALLATGARAQAPDPLADPSGDARPMRGAALPAGVPVLADLAYGNAARQRVDVYLPAPGNAPPHGAPILVMVHGGAWMLGDKTSRGVVGAKLGHWVAKGWILVSVNNRLWPEAEPLAQAEDVARALAFVQRHAAAWGGDAKRLVLMGHSAGAHLVALLGASPELASRSGAARWAGTVALDSAALDLAALMQRRHARFYDRVFGADPEAWRAASPAERLAADATPMLLVCSSLRADDSCGQAERFAARANALGAFARVRREALSHGAVNAELGRPGAYTEDVDAFIAALPELRR
ncbi:MAG: alpha/beta hydrolase [Caldimonas sp.]